MRRDALLRIRGARRALTGRTWVMGVVNVTPDSFSDGGLYFAPDKAAARGLTLLAEGADILDIGGESTRPGAEPVPEAEETARIVPVVRALRAAAPTALISIDTAKAAVARAALDEGADLINDVTAGLGDEGMIPLAAATGAGLVLMHMQGTPRTMQVAPSYRDVTAEVRAFLAARLAAARDGGVDPESVILDPGICFGKRLEDNLTLLRSLPALADLGRPLLVGVSRKSFLGRLLDAEPQDRLEGTLAASVLAAAGGAHILRVHDVKAVKRAVRVADAILAADPEAPPAERPEHSHAQ